MHVRPATLSDLTALRMLWEALCTEQSAPYPTLEPDDKLRWTTDMAMRLEQYASGLYSVITVLALDDTQQPIGFASGRLEERTFGSPRIYWAGDYLYVKPAHRGHWRGVGPQLLAEMLSHAAKYTDVTVVELVAIADDMHWKRHGWTPIMTRYATTMSNVLRLIAPRKRSMPPTQDAA